MIDPKLADAFTCIRLALIDKDFASETLKRELLQRVSDLETLFHPIGEVLITNLTADELIEAFKSKL